MSYLIAILFLLSATLFIIFIMSVTSMIIIGKKYFQRINVMWNFKVDKVFTFTQSLHSTAHFGVNTIYKNQYYFISINSDKKVCVFNFHRFVGASIDEHFYVESFDKNINNVWISNQFLISSSPCLFTTLLKMKVYQQAKKNIKFATSLTDMNGGLSMSDFINEFINKQVTQISRDRKIEKLLK